MMTLKKHIPSHIIVAGYRALISYDGQPQTCYGCGDTERMCHVCSKRRDAKIIATAPVDHTWANIAASTTTSVEVPGISEATTMDTDPGLLTMEDTTSSVTSQGQGEPLPASIGGLQRACDTPPSHVTVPFNQDSSNTTHLLWADEDPELEQNSSGGEKPSENVPASTKEWPPLPSLDVGLHNAHTSQQSPISPTADTDGTPAYADISTTSRTEHVPADLPRPGATRKKKLQNDKTGETTQDRKRNRTRTPVLIKEKY
jgi:hypothetical protein